MLVEGKVKVKLGIEQDLIDDISLAREDNHGCRK
jgi:hypothetical protein